MSEIRTFQVLVFPELTSNEGRVWTAQCIEINLCGQGETKVEAMASFLRTLRAHVEIRRNRDPSEWFSDPFFLVSASFTDRLNAALDRTQEGRWEDWVTIRGCVFGIEFVTEYKLKEEP